MRLAPLLTLALVFAPAAEGASRCVAPPGTAAVEQYCEFVPGASGPRKAGAGAGAGGAPRSVPGPRGISRSTARAIAGSGAGGVVAARVLGALPPPTDGSARGTSDSPGSGPNAEARAGGRGSGVKGSSSAKGARGDTASSAKGARGDTAAARGTAAAGTPAEGGNVLRAAGKAVTEGPQIGSVLPWILVLAAVALAGVTWFANRRRHRTEDERSD
jgi:hypothetical protein